MTPGLLAEAGCLLKADAGRRDTGGEDNAITCGPLWDIVVVSRRAKL